MTRMNDDDYKVLKAFVQHFVGRSLTLRSGAKVTLMNEKARRYGTVDIRMAEHGLSLAHVTQFDEWHNFKKERGV